MCIYDLKQILDAGLYWVSRSITLVLFILGICSLLAKSLYAEIDKHPYALFELEGLGGKSTHANAINENGWITGYSHWEGNYYHASVWDKNNLQIYDLGVLDGYSSTGIDINDKGQIAGGVTINDSTLDWHAMFWENGTMYDLGTLGGNDSITRAINNFGQVVGFSELITGDGWYQAFIWDKENGMVNLGALGPNQSCQAWDINNNGYAAGWSTIDIGHSYQFHSVIWTAPNELIDLGTYTGNYSKAYAINDLNQVVGYFDDVYYHSFIWQNGIMYDIHENYNGMKDSVAHAINNYAQVIGTWSDGKGFFKPYFWQPGMSMKPLSVLNPPNLHNCNLEEPEDINDFGQIVGDAIREGGYFSQCGFLLTPVYPSFDLAPAEPGIAGVVNTMTATNIQPGAKVHFVYNRHGGGAVIPGCDVTINALQIENPRLAGYAVADADGVAVLEGVIPSKAAGREILLQAVVVGSCEISNLVVQKFE